MQRVIANRLRTGRAAWLRLRRRARPVIAGINRLVGVVMLVVVLSDGVQAPRTIRERVLMMMQDDLFDYVTWEIGAVWEKAGEQLFGVSPYLDRFEQRAVLERYLARLAEVQEIEAEIERRYSDPSVPDPAFETTDLRAERDRLRRQIEDDEPLVEGIIEEQVSAVLADEDFAWFGQTMPPVLMTFSEIPTALIVSPRDRIDVAANITLVPMPIDERAALEARIDETLDVSSYIASLSGLSMYPSLILEPRSGEFADNLAYAFEVTAHEWCHHYLLFFPLGLEYGSRAETRVINETTATFFGREVAKRVMERFYPDLPGPVYSSFLAPPLPAAAAPDARPTDPDAPPPFEFGQAMNDTRVRVDFLLWLGQVDAAEAYMQARQRLFVHRGYRVRKLNQAYFAFYGGYQGQPGAGGQDPIGPAVEALAKLSPDLHEWLVTLRGITTRDELLAAFAAAQPEP